MATVIVLNQSQMGHGDSDLGRKILATCLRKLRIFPDLEAVVLYNSGVHLARQDSFVAGELSMLQEHGVDVLVCGTCVEHFDLTGQLLVERPSNMDDILAAMRSADKVITL